MFLMQPYLQQRTFLKLVYSQNLLDVDLGMHVPKASATFHILIAHKREQ